MVRTQGKQLAQAHKTTHILPSTCPPATCASVPAQAQEVLADLPAGMCCYSTPAAAAQLREALARLESEQLREGDYPEHHSLEALRLEDPATMSGCWNPGCATAFLLLAGIEIY